VWWDGDKFNWRHSSFLVHRCQKDFKVWYDPDKFDWVGCRYFLPRKCIKYIDIWYDSSRFEESYDEFLLDSIQ